MSSTKDAQFPTWSSHRKFCHLEDKAAPVLKCSLSLRCAWLPRNLFLGTSPRAARQRCPHVTRVLLQRRNVKNKSEMTWSSCQICDGMLCERSETASTEQRWVHGRFALLSVFGRNKYTPCNSVSQSCRSSRSSNAQIFSESTHTFRAKAQSCYFILILERNHCHQIKKRRGK